MTQVMIMNTSFCIVTKLWAGKDRSRGSETIRHYLLVERSHCVSKFSSEEKCALKSEMERDMGEYEGRKERKSLLMYIFAYRFEDRRIKYYLNLS